MGAVVGRRVRTSQPQQAPQIDWNNPITAGLVFAYVCGNEALGYSEDGRNAFPYTNGAGTPLGARVNTQAGTALQTLPGTNFVFGPVQSSVKAAAYSLFAFGTGPAAGAQSALDDDDGTTRRFQFRLNGGKVEFIPFYSGGNGDLIAPTALSSADLARGFAMGATANGTSAAVYQNGAKTSAVLGGAVLPPNPIIAVGGRKTGGTQAWANGGLSVVAMWNRALTDAEQASLADNPHQLFKPPARRLWLAYSATTSTTISASTGTETSTGQAAGLVLPTAIGAGTASETNAGKAAALVLPTTLTAGAASETSTGPGAALVLPTVLSASTGTETDAGQPAALVLPTVLSASTGTETSSGLAAQIPAATTINASTGTEASTGQGASVSSGAGIAASIGTEASSGQPAALVLPTVIGAGTARETSGGAPASVTQPATVTARTGTETDTGQAASLVLPTTIDARTASTSADGLAASLSDVVPALPVNPARLYVGGCRTRTFTGARRVRAIA